MKYLIVSDIHGSLPTLEKVISFYKAEKCDMLLILGDILNYGPRNGIPEGIDPIGIAQRLNEMAADIIAVRGNCDSEVDQMLLEFSIQSDYMLVVDNGKRLLLTHGHIYNEEILPKVKADYLFYGHTHLWKLEQKKEMVVCNTGSITFPKDKKNATFAMYENETISIHQLDGRVLQVFKFGIDQDLK